MTQASVTLDLPVNNQIITFKVYETKRDGACFFNTLSLGLFGCQDRSREIRRDVVNHIVTNYNYYEGFITHPTLGLPMTLVEYEAYMLKHSTYATFLEVGAASAMLRRRIIVFDNQEQICDTGNRNWEYIATLFTGHRDSGHFDLLWHAHEPLPEILLLQNILDLGSVPDGCPSQTNHPSTSRRKAGRPKKVKRGRPKASNLTSEEQHREAVQRYAKTNPNVNRGAVKRYTEAHPEVNRTAVKRYSDGHVDEIKTKKRVPASLRKDELIGEYSGPMLDSIKPYLLKEQSLFSNKIYDCPFCHARLFIEEKGRKKWCCCEGSYIVPSLPKLKAEFYKDRQFIKHPRAYNNLFAFSALGVSHGLQHPDTGISFLKIQGRTYHRVFDLAYTDSTNLCGMYIDDGEERQRLADNRGLNVSVVKAINDYLIEHSPFINLIKQLSKEPSDDAHLIFESTSRRSHGPVLGDAPRGSEIAAIISTERELYNPRKIVIWKVGAKKPHTIDVFHPLYEALQYPLLYPHGTPGWEIGLLDTKGKKISQVKYYRRLLLSEPRFSELGRLSEEWIVDMYCRVEEERLRYISHIQIKNSNSAMRTAPFNELHGAIATDEHRNDVRALGVDETIQGEGGVVPGRIYLPNTFTGSERYMKTKYMDGMSVVCRLGKPSYFLTVTCNPKWPEILQSTPTGTKASASLIARVFKLKLLELLRNLRSGAFFGKKTYLFYVIEFQKRGLPHSHICFRVEGGGPQQNCDIDKVVRADIPSAAEAGGRLRELVLTHMVHGPCGPPHRADLPCWDGKQKKCSKYFPKQHTDVTHVDDHGFVHYKRDSENSGEVMFRRRSVPVNDTWIVPYNPALLLKNDCHINLEIASTRKIVKYLFKYITKGADEARVAVVPGSDIHDEVEMYATKRYIGACDAAWRMLEFEITGREPNVIQLPVHLDGHHAVVFRPGHEADAVRTSTSNLLLYFSRPLTPEFDNLTYLEFFEQYLIHTSKPHTANVPVIAYADGMHFITKRQRGEMVARLFWVAPNRGELFYLRMLLNIYPCRNYKDLKALGGEGCMTFQEAARHLGLVNDELEYEVALKEAHHFMIGFRLRRFFVLLLVAGARGADLWNKYKVIITEDLLEKYPNDPDKAYTQALIQIDRSLRRHGSNVSEHGLPDISDDSTELGRELLAYSETQLRSFLKEWIPKLSSEQKVIFDYVHSLVKGGHHVHCPSLFIDGPAGSGKTLLLNVLASSLRVEKCVVLCTATSGISSQNYYGGVTAHSMFRLPLDIDNDNVTWGVTGGSQRAELIREATVIIFDEAPMAHKKIFHILDKSLRDLMQRNEPFGAKIVVLAGDFRQIPPVVVGARSSNDVVSTSLRFSPLWSHLAQFKLVQAQRTRCDTAYSEFLLRIGSGNQQTTVLGEGNKKESLVALHYVPFVTELNDLISQVFPTNILSDPDFCATRALLCVTNDNVDNVNEQILKILPGDPIHLLSVNYVDDANTKDFFLSADALANIHAKGVPDHELIIKKNAVCMITRNLHFDDGLLNGTKVIAIDISSRLVTVRKPGSQELYSIPRITFQASVEPGSPLKMYRRQFPLRLCYAMTVNKSQGQTIDFVGVDLRSDVFSHGQLYVALGRVRSIDSIIVLVQSDRVVDGVAHVRNVVYPQLL